MSMQLPPPLNANLQEIEEFQQLTKEKVYS